MRIGIIPGVLGMLCTTLSVHAQKPDSVRNVALPEVVIAETYQQLQNKKTALTLEVADRDFLRKHFTGNFMQAMENIPGVQAMEWLARLKDGRVKKIGMEGNFDTEIIIASQPDIIFVSPNRRGGYEVMKELNIPLVPYWAFKETSPLGLSEWIKVAGMFIGKEEEACQLFAQMEQRYNLLKAKVSNVKQRPSVFSGEMRRDTWYVPGGQSFYARLFADAGADYFMKDNPETGGVLMDFETVYAQGYNAGYWRVMNGYKGEFSYEALKASNPQYADFRAFKEKKVIYCNLEWIPLYENLPLSPDVLLSDMIKAFHPELLPDYHPVFYSLLEKE